MSVSLSLFFSFKSLRIFIGFAKLFVMSITLCFSSAFSRPARRWPINFGANSWLWITQSIAIQHSCVFFSKKYFNLNRHSHFLDPVPSSFSFFLVLGGLYSSLLSHCIVKYDLIKLDLFIEIVNMTLAACWRTQPSNSSRSLHLSLVVKNDPVFTSITRTLVGTGFGFSSKLLVGTDFCFPWLWPMWA